MKELILLEKAKYLLLDFVNKDWEKFRLSDDRYVGYLFLEDNTRILIKQINELFEVVNEEKKNDSKR